MTMGSLTCILSSSVEWMLIAHGNIQLHSVMIMMENYT